MLRMLSGSSPHAEPFLTSPCSFSIPIACARGARQGQHGYEKGAKAPDPGTGFGVSEYTKRLQLRSLVFVGEGESGAMAGTATGGDASPWSRGRPWLLGSPGWQRAGKADLPRRPGHRGLGVGRSTPAAAASNPSGSLSGPGPVSARGGPGGSGECREEGQGPLPSRTQRQGWREESAGPRTNLLAESGAAGDGQRTPFGSSGGRRVRDPPTRAMAAFSGNNRSRATSRLPTVHPANPQKTREHDAKSRSRHRKPGSHA